MVVRHGGREVKGKVFAVLVVVLAVLLTFGIRSCDNWQRHEPTITGIQRIGKVNVLYVGVAEAMTLSSKSRKSQMMWLVYGGGFYQIDLSKIRFLSDGERNAVEVPLPEVYAVANMKKSRPYKTSVALGYTDKAINRMWAEVSGEANKLVARAARSEDNMKIAKDQAETVIRQMIGEPVDIRWKEE